MVRALLSALPRRLSLPAKFLGASTLGLVVDVKSVVLTGDPRVTNG